MCKYLSWVNCEIVRMHSLGNQNFWVNYESYLRWRAVKNKSIINRGYKRTKPIAMEWIVWDIAMAGYFRYLRRNQPLELYFYAVPKLCLNLMGIWPGPEGTINWRAVMNFMILGIGVVTELHAAFTYARANQITLALETFCPASTSAVTLLKMFLLLRYRKDLFYVVSHQRDLLFGLGPMSRNTLQKEAIMSSHSLMAARFNFWPLTAGFFTAATYNVKPFIMALVLYLQGRGSEIEWEMPYNMT